jgi:hypothetical protein
MSAQFRAEPAAGNPAQATRLFRWGCKPPIIVLALAVLAAGCTRPPATPFVGNDPSDPEARVPRVGYSPTTAPYTRQRPVEPAPWREQNERVAPGPRE